MILIADSGSTKTDWRLIYNRQDIRPFQSIGFNPYFINTLEIKNEIDNELIPFINSVGVKEIYFYGAGCSSAEKCIIVEDALTPLFPNARIKVDNDLLGAARALSGHHEGLVSILGTGSNSCLFDGKKIVKNIPSLGYLLGDEGSGAYIGKRLIKEIYSLIAPKDICDLFEKKYNYNCTDVLSFIYNKPFPNRFLASFTKFVHENISHLYLKTIVKDAFVNFLQTQILKYDTPKEISLHFTGSVAYYFSDILKEVLADKGFSKIHIEKTPIDGLIEYHLSDLEKFQAIQFSSDV